MTTREYMARKLREFRSTKGLSVDEVGAAIGKSGKTISAWEVGRGQPDADKLVDLCKVYGVRIADFYSSDVSQGVTLTAEEAALIDSFRALNDKGKSVATAVLGALGASGIYDEQEES